MRCLESKVYPKSLILSLGKQKLPVFKKSKLRTDIASLLPYSKGKSSQPVSRKNVKVGVAISNPSYKNIQSSGPQNLPLKPQTVIVI